MNAEEKTALLRQCGIKFRVAVAAKALVALLWMPLGAFAAILVASRINVCESSGITWVVGGFRAVEAGDVAFVLTALVISCVIQGARVMMLRKGKADPSFSWAIRRIAMIIGLGCFAIVDQSMARSKIIELNSIVAAVSMMPNEQLAKMAKDVGSTGIPWTKDPQLGESKKSLAEIKRSAENRAMNEWEAARGALKVRTRKPSASPMFIRKELMSQNWWPRPVDFKINILAMLILGGFFAITGELLTDMASLARKIGVWAKMTRRERWRLARSKTQLALGSFHKAVKMFPQTASATIQEMYQAASATTAAISIKKEKLIDVGMGGDKGWCEAERALLEKEIGGNTTEAVPQKRSRRL